jgi:hypothetical protein
LIEKVTKLEKKKKKIDEIPLTTKAKLEVGFAGVRSICLSRVSGP